MAEQGSEEATAGLSQRGLYAQKPGRDDLQYMIQALSDPYDPETNPNGKMSMLVADNTLNKKKLVEKIHSVCSQGPPPEWVTCYGPMDGSPELCKSVASFLERQTVKAPVDASCISAMSGCGSFLDAMAWCLAEPGDTCIIPSPWYCAFQDDVNKRAGLKVKAAHTEHPQYELTEAILQRAYDEAVAEGSQVKMLLICHPCNPMGKVYSKETLQMCMEWCAAKKIHFVSDEIYAASVFPGESFTSVAALCHEKNPTHTEYMGNYVHILWAFSKDFSLSGFRAGILFTHNKKLKAVMGNFGVFQGISMHTQWVLSQRENWGRFARMLDDTAWTDAYLAEVKQKLSTCYQGLKEALDAISVPLYPSQGTVMAWADFRQYLPEPTWAAERELWLDLFAKSGVLFTTGESSGSKEPGFFRLCYAVPRAKEEDPASAMQELKTRLVSYFADKKAEPPSKRAKTG